MRQPVQVKPCEFCGAINHKTDAYPTLQEETQVDVNAVGEFQSYNNRAPQQIQQQQYYRPPYRQQQGPSHQSSSKSLEDVVKELAITIQQNQAKNDETLAELSKQMSNLAQTISELKRDPRRLPSQTVPNPRGNVSALTLRSGKDLNEVVKESASDQITDDVHFNVIRGPLKGTAPTEINCEEPTAEQFPTDGEHINSADQEHVNGPRMEHLKCSPPATWSVKNTKIDPLLSFSVQVRAPEEHMIEKHELGGRVAARDELKEPTMERPIAASHEAPPGKCKDPSAFTVTCGVVETQIYHCLIDLGAAINAMPYSLYRSLRLSPLKPPKLLVELGDKSLIHPIGLLEDLTLRVGDLVVPADFYVLQMGDARDDDPLALILGRPFLFANKTKIDMDTGLLSLAFGGKRSDFYIYEDRDHLSTKKSPDIVNTSYLGALVPDPPDETSCVARSAAIIKVSSQTRDDVKANLPDRWRGDASTSLHDDFGQIEGIAEVKFDLTRPWDPNL
ncbi:unnamed protein product [Rhodiola kirilowii]